MRKRNTIKRSSIHEHWNGGNERKAEPDQAAIFKVQKDQKMMKLLTQAIELTSAATKKKAIESAKNFGIEQKKIQLLKDLDVLFVKFEEDTRRCKNEIINSDVYQKRQALKDKRVTYGWRGTADNIIEDVMKTDRIVTNCDLLYRKIERGIKNG